VRRKGKIERVGRAAEVGIELAARFAENLRRAFPVRGQLQRMPRLRQADVVQGMAITDQQQRANRGVEGVVEHHSVFHQLVLRHSSMTA